MSQGKFDSYMVFPRASTIEAQARERGVQVLDISDAVLCAEERRG